MPTQSPRLFNSQGAKSRLKAGKPHLDPTTFSQRAADLEDRLDQLIDERRRFTDPDNKRFAKRLRKHRDHLLRFLYVDELDATNNLAERRLRPAVITRKTGGCNRTQDGADGHAILSSVVVTCRQNGIPVIDYLIKLQRFGEDPPSLEASLIVFQQTLNMYDYGGIAIWTKSSHKRCRETN